MPRRPLPAWMRLVSKSAEWFRCAHPRPLLFSRLSHSRAVRRVEPLALNDGDRSAHHALAKQRMTVSSRIYDVLVVGGGNAGLCAAIMARQRGASVLLLEQAPRDLRGGNSRHARSMR